MLNALNGRFKDYLILLIVGAALFFPNLGGHSLWDVDESHNAECAREMYVAGESSVPTFNYSLRTDKPVLLYWLMIAAYQLFGVTEFAARFWSAVCGLGSLILTYELGRAMFDRATGLLAGIVLGSAVMFCVISHAATPDSLLIFFTLLTFLVFWHGYMRQSNRWLLGAGVASGLAVLAKGPVGLALPGATILIFLLWQRRFRLLWNRKLLWGVLLFAAITLPWYIAVGVETKWKFFWDPENQQGFFLKHHLRRFEAPLEGHGGRFWFWYHPVVLLAAFAPWSVFLGLACWYGTGRRAAEAELAVSGQKSEVRSQRSESSAVSLPPCLPVFLSSCRFLWCWFLVWLAVFTVAGTKLPNYMLPAYPALAILTARFLVRWGSGAIDPAPRRVAVALACYALVGAVIGAGLLIGSGVLGVGWPVEKAVPGLGLWAAVGLLPIVAAFLAWRFYRHDQRAAAIRLVTFAAVTMVGLLAGFAPAAVDGCKVPHAFAEALKGHQVERDIQVGCFGRYQPGLVYYTGRQVRFIRLDDQAVEFLASPRQTFLVVAAPDWSRLAPQMEHYCRVVAEMPDVFGGRKSSKYYLVTNRPAEFAVRASESRPELWYSQ